MERISTIVIRKFQCTVATACMRLHISILPQLRNELRNRDRREKEGEEGRGIGRQGCMREGGRVGVVV